MLNTLKPLIPHLWKCVLLGFALFLSSCERRPEDFVVVPGVDSTPPTVAMVVADPDLIAISQTGQPLTIIAVEDVVSVIATARDDDGGIKSAKLWATTTYHRPGQTQGPSLAGLPVDEQISTAAIGESTLKQFIVAHNFDLRQTLGSWSEIKVDIWLEAENFHGGRVRSRLVSLTYPTRQPGDTDYMAYCRSQRVPIPPDWSISTAVWTAHGNLQTNLAHPGDVALIWTYSDSVRRGACMLIARSGVSDIAGIICQSATTGSACFWDGRLRNNSPSVTPIINWPIEPLIISLLEDGSNVQENCTTCHSGNNVFLLAPDDPTWRSVLALAAVSGSTFTTRVENSSDTTGDHPRYIPVTYPATRPGWVNTFRAPSCQGTCHEGTDQFSNPSNHLQAPPMPPACATNGDVENCYR